MAWIAAAVVAAIAGLAFLLFAQRRRVSLGATKKSKAFSADATAFVPGHLAPGEPSLVQIYINRPKDQRSVRQHAAQADESAKARGGTQKLGKIRENEAIFIELFSPNASIQSMQSKQQWKGKPLRFLFWATPNVGANQCAFEARVMLAGAQIGTIAFTQSVATLAGSQGQSEARMTPVKSVFLSYSSKDRSKVSLVAGAYARAGIKCFFDRTSLRSGEEWPPRLLKEIEGADLFHLFWSVSAADSPWVVKETRHALETSRSSAQRSPSITIQMLDGPPWAAHPEDLDILNFDDFTRAAVVGYEVGSRDQSPRP